jgi:hypothetical protein
MTNKGPCGAWGPVIGWFWSSFRCSVLNSISNTARIRVVYGNTESVRIADFNTDLVRIQILIRICIRLVLMLKFYLYFKVQ